MGKKIALAFSGGLDTTYSAVWLKESMGAEVVTVTVDTGGFTPKEIEEIKARSKKAGATAHILIDGRKETFNRVIKYLIGGNVLRGGVYPLCVSAERIVQAEMLVAAARKAGASAIAHGSTGAGNDQIRFDVAVRTLAPEIAILAPIRDQKISRQEQTAWLEERGIKIPPRTTEYSVNTGMWGTTIGGGETHDPWKEISFDAYPNVVAKDKAPAGGIKISVSFENGVPVSLDGKRLKGHVLVQRLNELGNRHGVGRGVHIGDTILGIKGRIAFEAPAAAILITAHRELEKLVLTKWQQFWKDKLADFYGMIVHEAMFYDPVARDIEAMIESSQSRVTGEVRIYLVRGSVEVRGVKSPFSLFDTRARYGEGLSFWDGRDAEGFAKIYGLQGRLSSARKDI